MAKVGSLFAIIPDWQELLSSELSDEKCEIIRHHERSGRPLGTDNFLNRLAKITVHLLKKQKPGPKKNN